MGVYPLASQLTQSRALWGSRGRRPLALAA